MRWKLSSAQSRQIELRFSKLSAVKNNSNTAINERRFLNTGAVMRMLGYSNAQAFWVAVRSAGIPFIRINARKSIFDESAIMQWLESRTVGGAK